MQGCMPYRRNLNIDKMVLNLLNRLFGSSIDALSNSSVAVEKKKKTAGEKKNTVPILRR